MFEWIKRMVGVAERRGRAPTDSFWFDNAMRPTSSGVRVTPDTSLQQITVYACVQKIAATIGSVPFITYRRVGKGKERATDHPLFRLLMQKPNPAMTRMQFFETMIPNLELRGNAYAWIERKNNGEVMALWPILPGRVRAGILDGERWYLVKQPDGTETKLTSHDMYHLMGMSIDGVTGLSRIEQAREGVGLAMAAESFGAGFFGSGAKPGGVLKIAGKMAEEDQEKFKKAWNAAHQGLDGMHKIALLEEGMEWESTTINPDDAQYIETQKFSVTAVARLFGVPPHIIGDHERGATFASVEQQSIDWVTGGVRERAVRIEQTTNELLGDEWPEVFTEFLLDALLRGDSETRSKVYTAAINNGWMTRNEARALENFNPLDGLDEMLMPLNMTTVSEFESGNDEARAACCDHAHDSETRREATERLETRVSARMKTRKRFRASILEAAKRLVRREVRELRAAFAKHLDIRDINSLNAFLEEFFGDELPDIVRETLGPVINAYADQVGVGAIAEVDADTFDIEDFMAAYMGVLGERHSATSRRAIEKVLALPPDERGAAFESLMSLWVDGDANQLPRDENITNRESIRVEGAVALTVWAGSGVTLFRWVNVGETCPICSELDGKVVGVGEPFATAGEHINPNKPGQPEGQSLPSIKVSSNTFNPPLHDGCDCIIVPG